jgi:hypothetical protein
MALHGSQWQPIAVRTHPVFHELRRLLNGIPLDARDARDGAFIHGCEHVLQPVARLMKESRALVKRHQRRCNYRPCRRVRNRRSLIAHEDGHRQTRRCARRGHHTRTAHLSIHAQRRGTQRHSVAIRGVGRHWEAFKGHQRPSSHRPIHPRAALLLRRPSERVEEKVADGRPVALHLEQPHLFIPHLRTHAARLDLHPHPKRRESSVAIHGLQGSPPKRGASHQWQLEAISAPARSGPQKGASTPRTGRRGRGREADTASSPPH